MDLNSLFKLSYALCVVSSHADGRINGQLANTVMQVTAEPVNLAVSISKQNLTHELIEKSRVFGVSVISDDAPLNFILPFGFRSGREIEKYAQAKHHIGKNRCPLLDENTTANYELRVVSSLDMNTHTLFIGELTDAAAMSEKQAMTYAKYRMLKGKTPKNAPTYQKD